MKKLKKGFPRIDRAESKFEAALITRFEFRFPSKQELVKLAIKCGISKVKADPYVEHNVRHLIDQEYGEKKVLKTKSGNAIMWYSRNLLEKELSDVLGKRLLKRVRTSAETLKTSIKTEILSRKKISGKDAANIAKYAIGLYLANLRGVVKEKFFYKIMMPIGFWLNENDE